MSQYFCQIKTIIAEFIHNNIKIREVFIIKYKTDKSDISFIAGLALLCSVFSTPVMAQEIAEIDASASCGNDIVITALRRSTSIQETPLAISAIGAESLNNQGISSSQQLSQIAPNLVIRESANGGSRVIIRNIQTAGEPSRQTHSF